MEIDTEKELAAFNEWITTDGGYDAIDMTTHQNGVYVLSAVYKAWEGWRARSARQPAVVLAEIALTASERHAIERAIEVMKNDPVTVSVLEALLRSAPAVSAGPDAVALEKQVAKLTFLLRTNIAKLDDETLTQIDLVECILEASRSTFPASNR